MQIETGALFFALVVAVLLAAATAWAVAGLYRRRMVALMRGGPPPDLARAAAPASLASPAPRPPGVLDETANRAAGRRLLLALAGLCLIIGLTQAWLALKFVYADPEITPNRLLVLGLVYAWPMALAWGLARRWSWMRVLAAVLAYLAVMAVLVMWRSTEAQTLVGVAGWLASAVAIPIAVTLAIGASGRIRAVAPYLLPIFLLLTTASVLVLQVLAADVNDPPAWLHGLVGTLGAWGTLLLFIFVPWLLLAWPVYALLRWLAGTYRDKRFSDLVYLFAAYWFVVLVANTLPAVEGAGAAGLTQLLPWLWIPVGMTALGGWLAPRPDPRGGPPTLLVLRVFQRDAAVERLFDQVVERWRLTGNTVLIAGTDLMSRTLDADDLFAFLNGRLAQRFIASEAEIPRRLAELDLKPDPDGRYRVNESYCFDTTWQAALRALVAASDVVLMDLRGFAAHNRGCRFELAELAGAAHLARVVLLFDADTDRHAAAFDLAGAPADRFEWIEAGRLDDGKTGQVLAALFHAGDPPKPGTRAGNA